MMTTQRIAETKTALDALRAERRSIGFVPTMGALHDGHLSLIEAAKRDNDAVVVSIFVNPLQFSPNEDLDAYPRTMVQDLDACRQHGVDLVFLPTSDEMYSPARKTSVHVADLDMHLCGKSRPGHFDGVCTVVAKLFNIVQPDRAYFGEKDFQQLVIIRRMTQDLNFPVRIVACPIVREPDGLAMSSRNVYLTPDERSRAAVLHRSMKEIANGRFAWPAEMAAEIRRRIESAGPNQIDYISIVDPESLQEVSSLDRPVRICLGVRFGKARLIDNMAWTPPRAGTE